MSTIVNQILTKETVDFLNNCYFADQNDLNFLNEFNFSKQNEKRILNAVDTYINLTLNDLSESELLKHKEELKESFLEYLNSTNNQNNDLNSIDYLTKFAFYRLIKSCKEYYTRKIYDQNTDKLENLRNNIKKLEKDYKLIKKYSCICKF